ncbi:MAG: hypothetical protein JWN31_1993 [Frankiales bacterium]|nr:hypothetical protein [Frankiales bacterium]
MNRILCESCGAPYRPDLTAWTCPVCDAPPPAGGPQRAGRPWDDSETRMTAIVLLGTLLNVLLLAALAAIVLAR